MRIMKAGLVTAIMVLGFMGSAHGQEAFFEYCGKNYLKNSMCPEGACQLQCPDGTLKPDCPLACVPRPCEKISAKNCPKQFCQVMTDCSKKESCQTKTPVDQIPACGEVAYSGQDVECCSGLVKRCGFDYLDGSCNMEGKNTPYHLPICIPCGNGVCTNFENHCNCPEDCKKDIIPLK